MLGIMQDAWCAIHLEQKSFLTFANPREDQVPKAAIKIRIEATLPYVRKTYFYNLPNVRKTYLV